MAGNDDQEVKTVVLSDDELKRVVRQAVHETLTSMGIDHQNPLEMQKDFQHLRQWRVAVAAAQTKTVITVIVVLVSGMLGALWLGLKSMLNQ